MSPLVIQLYLDFWCWHPHNLLVKSLPSLDLRCWMGGANLVFGDLAARSTAQLFVNVEAGSFSRWFSPFFRVTFHIFAGDIQASCCSSAHFCRSAWFFSGIITGMEGSWNGVGYPLIIHFPRIFQHKTSTYWGTAILARLGFLVHDRSRSHWPHWKITSGSQVADTPTY
jgi:hypothetical protein